MTAYGRRGHFATLLSETPTEKHTPYSKFKDAARDGTRDITRRPRAVQRNVGFVVRIRPKCKHSATAMEMRADMASVSTEEKVALEEKYGLAPGILGRDAPAGKDKAPSIKEMKATIRKAGFGVADLVEKSDVVKRYQEALARLGK